MISSGSSGRDWLLVFSFSSRVCVKRRREWKRKGRGQHREIKKGNLLPKSPQSYQAYVYAWNDEFHFIQNHGRRTFILRYLFRFFLILCPRPSSTPSFSLPSLALPVLPNSLFNEYLYFLFLAAPLWIQLWPYNIYHMFCPFHSAMKEAILLQSQIRFLSPINLAVKQRTVTVQ